MAEMDCRKAIGDASMSLVGFCRSCWTYLIVAFAGMGGGGCVILESSVPDPEPVPPAPDPLRAEVRQLQEWRLQVRLEIEALQREVETLKRILGNVERNQNENLQGLSARLHDLESVREQDRKFIVDELTRRLMELQTRLASPPPPASTRSGSGYEHVVKAGETLSFIARQYNTTVTAILKANGITDPNKIREGQKLFIPDS